MLSAQGKPAPPGGSGWAMGQCPHIGLTSFSTSCAPVSDIVGWSHSRIGVRKWCRCTVRSKVVWCSCMVVLRHSQPAAVSPAVNAQRGTSGAKASISERESCANTRERSCAASIIRNASASLTSLATFSLRRPAAPPPAKPATFPSAEATLGANAPGEVAPACASRLFRSFGAFVPIEFLARRRSVCSSL